MKLQANQRLRLLATAPDLSDTDIAAVNRRQKSLGALFKQAVKTKYPKDSVSFGQPKNFIHIYLTHKESGSPDSAALSILKDLGYTKQFRQGLVYIASKPGGKEPQVVYTGVTSRYLAEITSLEDAHDFPDYDLDYDQVMRKLK